MNYEYIYKRMADVREGLEHKTMLLLKAHLKNPKNKPVEYPEWYKLVRASEAEGTLTQAVISNVYTTTMPWAHIRHTACREGYL